MTQETNKPKRRWLRFSLRTFLIVLTIFCVWLGWYLYRVEQQREAVKWVKENGGWVRYYYEYDSNERLVSESQPPVPKWLHDILDENYFSSVVYVYLGDTKISDVKPLAGLTNLEELYLHITRVSDLKPLSGFTNLEVLGLENTNVSDEEIEKLKQALPNCKIHKSTNERFRHDSNMTDAEKL